MHSISSDFEAICARLQLLLLHGDDVMVGEWQAIHNPDLPMANTREALDVSFQFPIPESISALQNVVKPNLPWAEDHFKERVSGEPLNPAPSHEWWPYAQKSNKDHMTKEEKFSHTYPERMWPKFARGALNPMLGIRFAYGDLSDVLTRLARNLHTRQAFLPIWFPEDTGAPEGERVPCTLGYHFIVRNNRLHVTYYIRSCDWYRHFRDDVYMAARLSQWLCQELKELYDLHPGNLTMHIVSLHIFQAEVPRLEAEHAKT